MISVMSTSKEQSLRYENVLLCLFLKVFSVTYERSVTYGPDVKPIYMPKNCSSAPSLVMFTSKHDP
jgi:hypothetical protein